ncbi:hypothetical protein GCM10023228_05550 [Brevibacillus fulvus]
MLVPCGLCYNVDLGQTKHALIFWMSMIWTGLTGEGFKGELARNRQQTLSISGSVFFGERALPAGQQ